MANSGHDSLKLYWTISLVLKSFFSSVNTLARKPFEHFFLSGNHKLTVKSILRRDQVLTASAHVIVEVISVLELAIQIFNVEFTKRNCLDIRSLNLVRH